MKKYFFFWVICYAVVTGNFKAQCNSVVTFAADNMYSSFHAGAAYNAGDQKWYGWGENMPNTGYGLIDTGRGYPVANANVVKVSGGSSGSTFNQMVILAKDNKIHTTGVNGIVTSQTTINLPAGVTYDKVKSLYAGPGVIAIVADGLGYVFAVDNNANQGAAANSWSAPIRDTNGNTITNFTQIRGATDSSQNTGLIGFTSSNQLYVWGTNIMIPGNAGSITTAVSRNGAELVTLPAAMTGSIVLVQANKISSGHVSWYFLTSTKQLWAIGNNSNRQLGDFTATNRSSWVRVKKNSTTDADVKYFSTREHDRSSGNIDGEGYVMMILDDKSVYGFGFNTADGMLGINSNTVGAKDPTLAYNSAGQTFDGSTLARQGKFVEAGGHITIIISEAGSICGAGHGQSGSVLGTTSSSIIFSQCASVGFTPCPSVVMPVDAVDDNFGTLNIGATTTSVITNDTNSAGTTAVIGSAAGQVAITTVTDAAGTAGSWPQGIILNADGTITISNTATSGAYTLYYKICEQTALTNCDVAKVTFTVPVPTCTTTGANLIPNGNFSNTNLATDWAITYDNSVAGSGTYSISGNALYLLYDNLGNGTPQYTLLKQNANMALVANNRYNFSVDLQSLGTGNRGVAFEWVLLDASNNVVQSFGKYRAGTITNTPANIYFTDYTDLGINTWITVQKSFYATTSGNYKMALKWITLNNNAPSNNGTNASRDIGVRNLSLATCSSACYRKPATGGTVLPANHGITALARAGANQDNWPMVRNGAWTALEAKTKGFVFNRVPAATANVGTAPNYTIYKEEPLDASGNPLITSPVEGMAFYDTTNNCLKINYDGTRSGWSCTNTKTCPAP